jgi:hypothetical protein
MTTNQKIPQWLTAWVTPWRCAPHPIDHHARGAAYVAVGIMQKPSPLQ